ncbi:MAG: hypothetical protein RLZZ399_1835 [Verrucomicrobiota bacterium]|jgi:biopolymer transport protein ExbD
MIKRHRRRSDEIMLIPFLDILCSLIGVLVLIIVVLVVAQTQRVKGRTHEEMERAQEHLKMLKQKADNTLKYAGLEEKLEKLAKIKEEKESKTSESAKLQAQILDAKNNQEKGRQIADSLRLELENLKTEIRGLDAQEPGLRKKLAELQEALAKLAPPENRDPSVIVSPTGQGFADGTLVFFVEASGEKLTYFWNEKDKGIVSAVPEIIVADPQFNAFLDQIAKMPQSKMVFLLREDGMRSYNLAAGWAQSKYKLRVDQIGKMPIPGRGSLDLNLFKRWLGNLPPPPAPPAPAPPKP